MLNIEEYRLPYKIRYQIQMGQSLLSKYPMVLIYIHFIISQNLHDNYDKMTKPSCIKYPMVLIKLSIYFSFYHS